MIVSKTKIAVLGGCGHIGLPLSIGLARAGFQVSAIDKNLELLGKVNQGVFPFIEENGDQFLREALDSGRLSFTSQISEVQDASAIIICIGTPVDENLSPIPRIFEEIIDKLIPHIAMNCTVILRSTVFPGTTRLISKKLKDSGAHVAFCPERILQGHAFTESELLPNIISGCSEMALSTASFIFQRLGPTIEGEVESAEVAKLFLNAYRYINFAISNEFFMIANDAGIDYNDVLNLMKTDYPRANGLSKPGLSAGPCLMKDTMQILAFAQNKFLLGNSAFLTNEGLAVYLAKSLSTIKDLGESTVGLLGMSFKAESDDIRSSLSYRVKKTLQLQGVKVICADPYVKDDRTLLPVSAVLQQSDVIVICTPHKVFRDLNFSGKFVLDIWGEVSETLNLGLQLESKRQ